MVEIDRIEGLLQRHGAAFLNRCFTAAEQAYCQSRHTPAMHFAARFCAKEAVLKALGTGLRGKMAWTDINITADPLGKPHLELCGATAEQAAMLGIKRWHISLTHTRQYAMAGVIAEGGPAVS